MTWLDEKLWENDLILLWKIGKFCLPTFNESLGPLQVIKIWGKNEESSTAPEHTLPI